MSYLSVLQQGFLNSKYTQTSVTDSKSCRSNALKKPKGKLLTTALTLIFCALHPVSTAFADGLNIDLKPIKLSEAINQALAHAPEWQRYQKQIAAQQEGVTQARSALLPSLVLSAQTTKTDTETPSGDIEGNSHSVGITLSQPLLAMDAWFNYQASKESARQLDHSLNATYQAFIVDIASTYLDVLRAQSQLTFAQAELNAIKQQLEQAQQRFRVGLIAITDVHEAQAAYDLAEVNQIAASTDLDIRYENLGRLTGTTINAVAQVKQALPITNPKPNNMSQWVTLAQTSNPNVLAAKSEKARAHQNYLGAKSLYSPTLNLFINRFDNHAVLDTSDSETTQIGLELNYPIFSGFRTKSLNDQTHLEKLAAGDNLTAALKNSTQATRNLFRSVQTDVLRVRAREQAIKSSSSALEATEAGYEVGTRNVVDVLNAQRSLFAAKRDLASAKYDYILHTLQLNETAGTIEANTITELDQWLE